VLCSLCFWDEGPLLGLLAGGVCRPLVRNLLKLRCHAMRCPGTLNPRVYEDGADEIVLRVDAPCQLLGVGLCGTHGGCGGRAGPRRWGSDAQAAFAPHAAAPPGAMRPVRPCQLHRRPLSLLYQFYLSRLSLAFSNTHTHTHTHTRTHARTHTHTCTRARTRARTRTPVCAHITYTHTHAHARTHTQPPRSYTAEVQVLAVEDDDFEAVVETMGSGTRTVTRADGPVRAFIEPISAHFSNDLSPLEPQGILQGAASPHPRALHKPPPGPASSPTPLGSKPASTAPNGAPPAPTPPPRPQGGAPRPV
jgi:hypothetical protein